MLRLVVLPQAVAKIAKREVTGMTMQETLEATIGQMVQRGKGILVHQPLPNVSHPWVLNPRRKITVPIRALLLS